MSFEELYQKYFQEIYFYVKSLSRNEKVAEEITQETFFKAFKHLDSFDGSKDIRAWLFTIAKNAYYSSYKKSKREISGEFQSEPIVETIFMNQLVNSDAAFKVHQFIHEMDEPYKEVFTLRVFGELPFEKIGLLFGKSASWARVTYYRAKKKIAQKMEENDG
ncbi:RNA polymerase sigma factor [Kurthia sibirica]|uniref:RNA polymerase subunit sigma n=1 Tax=Kurthia sibirica TaxID=202750 RepID=A0A2U3AIV0_9BACL|nr:RNA polymerase sigma factor [Kurthia sibirica]PWI24476.1 RNA polymerase subunit sigma [Kurthia sibirica]GEK35346.1 RNA polymerase subunit sigma [Kurthia sibirica]